jgi:transcriptional regulator with XRE-family HTH domain
MGRRAKTDNDTRLGLRLGASLRLAREASDLTTEALAAGSSIAVDTVRAIERGVISNPGFFTVGALALVLNIDLESLFDVSRTAAGDDRRAIRTEPHATVTAAVKSIGSDQ